MHQTIGEGGFIKNKLFNSGNKQELFQEIFYAGLKDAVRTSLGIFKIMIPVSLLWQY